MKLVMVNILGIIYPNLLHLLIILAVLRIILVESRDYVFILRNIFGLLMLTLPLEEKPTFPEKHQFLSCLLNQLTKEQEVENSLSTWSKVGHNQESRKSSRKKNPNEWET